MDITEERLQNALDAAKKRLKDLEKRYDTAIEQYQYYLGKDIESEKLNIAVLEEKLKEINKDKFEKLNKKFDEYKYNHLNKVYYSFNNFEAAMFQALHCLHIENIGILQYIIEDEKLKEKIIKTYNKMFYENLEDKIGIKVDYEKFR